ncbi:hypothetical protein MHYP_G00165080 [Metynnis hypsauchen]
MYKQRKFVVVWLSLIIPLRSSSEAAFNQWPGPGARTTTPKIQNKDVNFLNSFITFELTLFPTHSLSLLLRVML